MGNRLIAEYRVQEGKYYYYTPDQINSTRIVTNDSGAVIGDVPCGDTLFFATYNKV